MSDKIAIITDTHMGARNSSNVFRQLFREWYREVFFPYIKENNIKTILHGGDFFDSRNSISLHDIDYVLNEWIPQLEATGATMYIIPGNHDVAYKNTNKINSVSLLSQSKSVEVCHDVTVIETEGEQDFVLCPWVNEENEKEITDELKKYADQHHILLGHFEIQGCLMYKTSPPCEHGFKPEDFKGFHKVLSGHFHHKSQYGIIEYLGAAFHFNWQDYNDWRGFRVYDPGTDDYELIENEFSLFTRFVYSEDLLETDKSELKDMTEGQFVQIVINQPYSKVELKDLVVQIEKCSPISVDIIDKTILDDNQKEDESVENDANVKGMDEYFDQAIENISDENIDSTLIRTMIDELKESAKEQMKEIE